jgi:opacity protein-like surface antigen
MEEMMKLKLTLAVAALLTIGLSSAAAYADTVTFTLSSVTGFIPAAGGSVTFDATVSAPASNGAAIFLNGDSFNITAPITLDDSDFFSDFPRSLAPGTNFTGALFELSAPPNTPFGTYPGTFTLLGGADGNAGSALGTVSFALVTPEPSSILLMMTGMGGLAWAGFKRNLRGWAR